MTPSELRALGVVTDLPTAARCYGIGRSTAYELARRGEFPVRLMRVGSRYRVRVADLLEDLAVPAEQQAG